MSTNRALEFLYKAQDSFPLLHDRWGWKAKQFVALAIGEVQELLAELETQRATPAALPMSNGAGVLIVDAAPLKTARLVECPRAAITTREIKL